MARNRCVRWRAERRLGTPEVVRHLGHGVHDCAWSCAHGQPALPVLAQTDSERAVFVGVGARVPPGFRGSATRTPVPGRAVPPRPGSPYGRDASALESCHPLFRIRLDARLSRREVRDFGISFHHARVRHALPPAHGAPAAATRPPASLRLRPAGGGRRSRARGRHGVAEREDSRGSSPPLVASGARARGTAVLSCAASRRRTKLPSPSRPPSRVMRAACRARRHSA